MVPKCSTFRARGVDEKVHSRTRERQALQRLEILDMDLLDHGGNDRVDGVMRYFS